MSGLMNPVSIVKSFPIGTNTVSRPGMGVYVSLLSVCQGQEALLCKSLPSSRFQLRHLLSVVYY
jgi:hypothetical protein